MRDILLTLFIFGTIPYIFSKPYIGVLVWSWLGYMNPHRLTWGFAYSMPFTQVIALATLLSVLFSKEKKTFPVTPITVVLILFLIYISISTIFAIYPDRAFTELIRVYKIQTVIFLTLILFNNKARIHQLIWVIAASIGFYGLKGGLFAFLTGGDFRVWGPAGSFIEGNNELGLALIVILPLFFYLKDTLTKKWHKRLLLICIGLITISILSTYSRGAFLALAIISFYLWVKMPNKLPTAIAGIILAVVVLGFMPDKFFNRMDTIETYQEDASAMGRINAWTLAINIANDRFFAGGAQHWSSKTFQMYAPVPDDVHDAHSIYFEILGEQGYMGLFLFLLLYILAFKKAGWIIKKTRDIEDLKWCNSLIRMIQVSLIGYASGGAFLGLAYWDLPYHLVAIVVVVGRIVENYKPQKKQTTIHAESKIIKSPKKKWTWE